MAKLFADEANNITCLVHGGDYCMTAQWRHIERWLTDHELTTTPAGRLLPIVPTRGNHDSAVGFEEMFAYPTLDTPYYYSTQLSSRVGLVTLNTEISVAGDQRDWLKAELPPMREKTRWLFAIYHRPAFSSVRDVQDGALWVDTGSEQLIVPLASPDAVKAMLAMSIEACQRHGRYVGICGQGPSDHPDLAEWLVDRRIESMSLNPDTVVETWIKLAKHAAAAKPAPSR